MCQVRFQISFFVHLPNLLTTLLVDISDYLADVNPGVRMGFIPMTKSRVAVAQTRLSM